VSGVSSSAASSALTVGTNVAPITFSGIASGIDYNSIVTKLTNITLAPNTAYNNQITQLNAKNAELIKINGMLASVQNALTALSDPATFNSYSATSSDALDASATQIPSMSAVPGTYTVESTHLATSTQIGGGATAGVTVNASTALISAGTAITPSNGGSQRGQFTVDGIAINYDVGSDSLATVVSNIYNAVHAVDSTFAITASPSGVISMSSSSQQISMGSATDRGNLEQVLKLDVAQVQNGGALNSVTGAGPVGGINYGATLSAAGYASAVTNGTFTINGVQIAVSTSDDNTASVLAKINNSTAGVVAAYDITQGTFSITSKATGAQSVIIGASSDSSNFLQAARLTVSTGSATNVGKQAFVSVLTANGALQTTYSNSDNINGAIPGMVIAVGGTTSNPFNITVAQSTSTAVAAISAFVSVYNAALNEIATASAAPIVQQNKSTTASSTTTSSQLVTGGVLYGDEAVRSMAATLSSLVYGISTTGSLSYNSLQSIGLSPDSTHQVFTSNKDANGQTINTAAGGLIQSTTALGTSGQFLPLDVAKFSAAFEADPSTVGNLFTAAGGLAYKLGTYLTSVTGAPTLLATGLAGSTPKTSLFGGDENTVTAQITSLNQVVQQVTDRANAQADRLRAQFSASEALVAQYQSEQSLFNQITGSSSSS
jgi:flagellar hook-associated protein 2